MAASRSDYTGVLPAQTSSAQETQAVARGLAALLQPGVTVALHGDLGAGKTEFVKGLVSGLGGDPGHVSSPTFGIVQEYAVSGGLLIHIDAYRTESEKEFFEMGIDELVDDAMLVAVEWPSRMGAHLPEVRIEIALAHLGGDRREIRLGP